MGFNSGFKGLRSCEDHRPPVSSFIYWYACRNIAHQ